MSNINETTKQTSLDALLNLDLRSVKAVNPADLAFIIVNVTITLGSYRQAAFFTILADGKFEFTTASGLVSVAEDSPYAIWISSFVKTFPRILPKEAGCRTVFSATRQPTMIFRLLVPVPEWAHLSPLLKA